MTDEFDTILFILYVCMYSMYIMHTSQSTCNLSSLPRWSGVPFPLVSALAVVTVDTLSAAPSLALPLSLTLNLLAL